MAPETVRHVVVLDFGSYDQGWHCSVSRWDPRGTAKDLVRVSWNAERSQSPGYVPAAGGVVWVAAPPGYEHSRYLARARQSVDPMKVCWTEGLPSGTSLMLVAVMPADHILASMESGPEPEEAKRFGNRMAVFWPISSQGRIRVCWTLRESDPGLLDHQCELINEQSPQRLGAFEDSGEATAAELRRWESDRQPPKSSPPAEAAAQSDAWELL